MRHVPGDVTVADVILSDEGVEHSAPREACGVFGVYAPGRAVAHLTYDGLYALQHRGQESAGMAVSDGSELLIVKDMGLVSNVFNEYNLGRPRGLARHRPHPVLHHRLLDVAQRPARLPPGRQHGVRPRPQRQPDQHLGPRRRARHAARHRGQRQRRHGRAGGSGSRSPPRGRLGGRAGAVIAEAGGGVFAGHPRSASAHRRPRPARVPAPVPGRAR